MNKQHVLSRLIIAMIIAILCLIVAYLSTVHLVMPEVETRTGTARVIVFADLDGDSEQGAGKPRVGLLERRFDNVSAPALEDEMLGKRPLLSWLQTPSSAQVSAYQPTQIGEWAVALPVRPPADAITAAQSGFAKRAEAESRQAVSADHGRRFGDLADHASSLDGVVRSVVLAAAPFSCPSRRFTNQLETIHYRHCHSVEDFLNSLSGKQAQKVVWVLKLIEELDQIPRQYFKKLTNTDDIWEVRVQFGGNIFRLLSFFDGDSLIILTSGFAKKTQKTPQQEIKIAEQRKRDYFDRR